MNAISMRLVCARKLLGLTQQEAAKDVGVSRNTLGQWESTNREPRISLAMRVCRVYGISPEYLCWGEPKTEIDKDIEDMELLQKEIDKTIEEMTRLKNKNLKGGAHK